MQILGTGLLARAFSALDVRDDSITIVAKGVADSRTTDDAAYEREDRELAEAIDACRPAGRTLVYLSGGGAIYGPRTSIRHEDDELRPMTRYGQHQLRCEQAVMAGGVPFLIARIPNAVGHPQRGTQLVPSLVRQVRSGRVTIDPSATRDLIDAVDVATLVTELLATGLRDVPVNIASGISTPVGDIVAAIERLLGTTADHLESTGGPDPQRFSVERLQSRLPAWRPAATYPLDVLARYVPGLALDDDRGGA